MTTLKYLMLRGYDWRGLRACLSLTDSELVERIKGEFAS